ncbi:MAG: enoyl-CoA hydratase/isomerase family protein [Hydrogenophaga sp.]|uniref:enoyl-CoA hydratase/isomerase family protein n=1 Tax=Hydrogenophaga sp. TaxID=1904254 RepID=UPI002ABB6AEE|nr:enoyl-CoA hydratase/isomerase family protein [Hydrogenophaga sp.]MDZ4173113.1 enoyl-CoA hydratase/isomerase family protein [Hydrogenophaga sp.]
MTNDSLVFEDHDSVLWIRINRPKALNALNDDVLKGLNDALDFAEGQTRVNAVVVTGTGRAFCAGADLVVIHDHGTADTFLKRLNTTLNRLECFPKPVVAMVNGLALAGGLELILCCDVVLAARSAAFGDGHARYGLLPGGGASVRLPRIVGLNRAKYLFFSGETMPAEAFVSSGLVHQVVDDDQLLAATAALVAKIAQKSPLGLRRMKSLANESLEQTLEVALRREIEAGRQHQTSHDMQEGLAAFKGKRAPRFTGC